MSVHKKPSPSESMLVFEIIETFVLVVRKLYRDVSDFVFTGYLNIDRF